MAKITNKQIANAFRKAVPFLRTDELDGGKTSFICFAVDDATDCGRVDRRACDKACEIIGKRLGVGCGSIHTWLRRQGIPEKDLTHDRVQAHRHAWLQQLIKEFETKK